MTTTLDDLLIKLGVDADEVDSGMEKSVKSVEKSFDRMVGDADKASKAIDDAGKKAEKSFDLTGTAAKAGTALKGVGSDADRAGAAIEAAGKPAGDGFVRGVMSGIGDLDNKLGSAVESAFDKVKGPALAGGAAAGATFMMGLTEGFSREAGADMVAARMGLDPADSERIGRISGELYANAYGSSMDEVGSAVDAVMSTLPGMLSASDSAIEATTAKAHDLATGFGFDVVRSVGLAGVSIRHGLAKDSDHAFDLITTAMQKMPASMREELFPAIEEYGGFLNNMGFTGEEAFGLLAAASHDGMFAIDKTGDAIKELSIRATDMSTLSVDSFEAAGLNAEQMAGRFLAGGATARGALNDLVDGLLAIEDPTDRANAAIGLFGTPLEDLSVTEIPAFLQSLVDMDSKFGDVSGAADDFGATLNENAQTNIESFKRRALGGLVDFIGGEVIPAALDLADTYGDDLGRAFDKAAGFFQRNEKAMQGLAVVAGVVAGLVVAHFVAMGAAAVATAVVHGAQVAFMIAKYIALGVAALASAAQMAIAWLIGLGPILLIGVAIAAFVALVIIHWDTIVAATKAAFGFVVEAVKGAFNWVKENWPLLLAILLGPFGLAVLAITKNWDTIKAGATAVKDWIVDRFDAVVSFFTGLPGRISAAASGLWDGIRGGLGDIVGWVWDQIRSLIRAYNSIPMVPDVSVPGASKSIGSIPKSHSGELLPGGAGDEMLRVVQGGEEILSRDNPRNIRNLGADVPMPRGVRDVGMGGGGGGVNVYPQGSILAERDIERIVQDAIDRGSIRTAA